MPTISERVDDGAAGANVAWTIPALDGRPLAAALDLPPAPRAAVVLAGANGVPQRFYAGTAAALAARGCAVLRFDYRGLGGSRSVAVRQEPARMRDWGALDVAGAIAWLGERLPAVPLHVLGHSAGGWLTGLAPNAARLHSIVTVASQSGYWRLWPWPQRAAMLAFWFAVLPASVAAFGYLPGFVLGGGEPLPRGVALDWARWGRRAEFMGREHTPGFEGFTGRLRAYAVAGDDVYAPRAAVERFATFYGAARTREVLPLMLRGPRGERPGHFTVFGSAVRAALADELAAFLLADPEGSS